MIIYEGPSTFNGQPLCVIATGHTAVTPSENSKTGPMVQVWIVPDWRTASADAAAVCGSCPLRRLKGARGLQCYVSPQPLWSIERKLRAGGYPTGDFARLCTGPQPIRLGSWGDPTAVPFEVWRPVLSRSRRTWTGYTHFWREVPADPWAQILMASVESVADAHVAWSLGWRPFRIRPRGETGEEAAIMSNEISCPASKEAGRRTACAYCCACDGRAGLTDRRRSVTIIDHTSPVCARVQQKAAGVPSVQGALT